MKETYQICIFLPFVLLIAKLSHDITIMAFTWVLMLVLIFTISIKLQECENIGQLFVTRPFHVPGVFNQPRLAYLKYNRDTCIGLFPDMMQHGVGITVIFSIHIKCILYTVVKSHVSGR